MRAGKGREIDWANGFEEFAIMKNTIRDKF